MEDMKRKIRETLPDVSDEKLQTIMSFVKDECDHILCDNLESASVRTSRSSRSSRSSRKRARELYWPEVLRGSGIDINPLFISPTTFMELTSESKKQLLELWGLNEEQQKIVINKVEEAAECTSILPSPSNMKISDIPKIHEGSLSLPNGFETIPLPAVDDSVLIESSALLTACARAVVNVTKMDVVVRIFLALLHAIANISDVKVKLQPTLDYHTGFTDFLIQIQSSNQVRLIEVKKDTVTTNLASESDITAQTLREAQILLSTTSQVDGSTMPILVTNGREFSFGIVEKVSGSKISLKGVYNAYINLGQIRGWKQAVYLLNSYVSNDIGWLTEARPAAAPTGEAV